MTRQTSREGTASAELECHGVVASPGGAPVLDGVDLVVDGGTLTVLAGPSGVGKTTLLRTVAGLQTLEAGSIRLAGRDLDGVPPHRRGTAYVFQRPRLFPHLDVTDNVAFPLRMDGVSRDRRRARARERLDLVGIGVLADRSTRGLSGGEAQRVALARALCGDPALLLLDEPLASVDPSRRQELRALIADLQRQLGITTVYVTHDRSEAAELGDRIAFMHDGTIVQHGPPPELFERPVEPTVARFFGSPNVLRGVVRGGRLEVGGSRLAVPGGDGPATFTIRPERIRIGAGDLRMRVVDSSYRGDHVRLNLRGGDLDLEAHVEVATVPPSGQVVDVDLPRDDLWRFPDPEAGDEPRSASSTRVGAP